MRPMTMLRRMMATALALCILWMTAALAAENEFTFALNGSGDGYVVTGYTGSDSSVTVPDWHDGLPVTEVGGCAFQGKTGVQAVSLPNTVVRIGASAFKGCTSLGKMTTYTASAEPPTPPESVRTPGDADGDGAVNLQDALLLMQYAAGWNVSIDKSNADVDQDGAVTMDDVVLLFQYAAGESVTLK